MSWLSLLISKIIAALFAAMIGDKRANTDAKNLGAAEAKIKSDQIMKEIADEQATNNAKLRDLGSVIDRLQRDATGNG